MKSTLTYMALSPGRPLIRKDFQKKYFVNMFSRRFPDEDTNEQLHIKAYEDIKSMVGKLKKIVKAGKFPYWWKENEVQSNKVLEQIATVAVVVDPHKTLNQISNG